MNGPETSQAAAPRGARALRLCAWCVLGLAALLLLGALIVVANRAQLIARLTAIGWEEQSAAAARNMPLALLHGAIVLGVTGGLLWLGAYRQFLRRHPLLLKVVIGGVLAFDLGIVGSWYIETYDAWAVYSSNRVVELLKSDPQPFRLKLLSRGGIYDYWVNTAFQRHNIQVVDRLVAREINPEDRAFMEAMPSEVRFWQLLNARYLLGDSRTCSQLLSHPQLGPYFESVLAFDVTMQGRRVVVLPAEQGRPGRHTLMRFKAALPRAIVYLDWERADSAEAALARLGEQAFDPGRNVVLVAEGDAELPTPPAQAAAQPVRRAVVRRYDPTRIEIELDPVERESVLLFNDRYTAHWKARADGKDVPLVRANYIMRGVVLPPGAEQVVLRYDPPDTLVKLSAAAMLLALGWGVVACVRCVRRKPVRPDVE